PFVAGASLVAGLWLALVGELLAALASRPLRLLLLGVVAVGCLQIYARGVLGAASRLTYELGRDLALLAALSAAASAVGALRVRSRPLRAPALPSGAAWRR
ncbi:MAG TPA: hypothetical protein VFO85_08580, partial [Vicinamibacteria bacterium]|nr:hypothetical protein [Vicinamibacteria bacterium]